MAAPLHTSKGKNVISKKDTCAYFWKSNKTSEKEIIAHKFEKSNKMIVNDYID